MKTIRAFAVGMSSALLFALGAFITVGVVYTVGNWIADQFGTTALIGILLLVWAIFFGFVRVFATEDKDGDTES